MIRALTLAALFADPHWLELNRAARLAVQAKDYPKLRDTLVELAPLMPGNARIAYNLAASRAKLGDTAAAMEGLRGLATAGLVYDLAADADFASLHALPAYAEVVRRMAENKRPVTQAKLFATLAEPDLIPESIVFDSGKKRWLVASVSKSKIIDANGALFAKTDQPAYALAIDPRRRILWAACESSLQAFDLATAASKQRIASPVKGVLGDMTIARTGDLYIGDSKHGAIFRLRQGASELERLDTPGEFPSPQTPALSRDQKTLYIPDYLRGIAAMNLATRAVTWLRPASGVILAGIDGLYLHRNRLLAIQNGTQPPRVVEMPLDLSRQRVLEANWPGLGEPTHGAIQGRSFFFIANAGWDRSSPAPIVSTIRERPIR